MKFLKGKFKLRLIFSAAVVISHKSISFHFSRYFQLYSQFYGRQRHVDP